MFVMFFIDELFMKNVKNQEKIEIIFPRKPYKCF